MAKAKEKEAPKVEEAVEETEADRVKAWNRGFFREVMGKKISDLEIEKLVSSTASPHDARLLLSRGCPHSLIVDILS